mgnify:CR=1 FL=1
MNAGKVTIDLKLLSDALKFPEDWRIESIEQTNDDFFRDTYTLIISGMDFPEVKELIGFPKVQLLCHKQQEIRYKVKEYEDN